MKRIEEFFKRYGLSVGVNRISEGPSVVTYGITTKGRTKSSQVLALLDDLSLTLSRRLRMFVNHNGGYIAVEMPKESPEMVTFNQIDIPSSNPMDTPIGLDMQGKLFRQDITKMPHLLVAGTTGSGKSVLIHAIISYLISHNTKDILQLVLIDPKRVELVSYQDIPHLAIPVQTDITDAINTLDAVVKLMENRYTILEDASCRNIGEYNDKANIPMPYILVVIDELADLMMTSKGQVEGSIVRLAQMARAIGIHLILATQRPSTDVVTGLIKGNFPTRIALSVVSGMDSRVILDKTGAERLIGKGDMLYMSPANRLPVRLQGAYISSQKTLEICRSAISSEIEREKRRIEMEKLYRIITQERWIVDVEYIIEGCPDKETELIETLKEEMPWRHDKVQSQILSIKSKGEVEG